MSTLGWQRPSALTFAAAFAGSALAGGALTWSHEAVADEGRGGASLPLPVAAPVMTTLSTTATSAMGMVRSLHALVRLNDGRVLAAGGPGEASTTAEIFDPATQLWTPTATAMVHAHDWPVASALCDGRVFVGGRLDASSREAEIYDPIGNSWSAAGKMKFSHIYGAATLLADCRLLISGGYIARWEAEIFDPASGLFTTIEPMKSSRFFHSATLLADGRVLVAAGGVNNMGTWVDYPSAEIFDPLTGSWSKAKSLNQKRRAHTATRLPDGLVLVAGGMIGGKVDGTQGGVPVDTAEVYDPVQDTWGTLLSKPITPRTFHTAALLPNGALLLFGGLDGTGSASRQVEGFFEGAWQALDPLQVDRMQHGSALLDDGRVLVSGGVHQATAEIYSLAQPGEVCTSSFLCAAGHCVDGVCCNEACDTGCRLCNVPGKVGTCSPSPCEDETHARVCSDGTKTCPNDSCVAKSCGELRCNAEKGTCLKECTSVEDCAAGYACDFDGQCVPPPDVSGTEDEACSAGAAGSGGGALTGVGAALTALAAIGLSRRRRNGPRQ